MIGDYTKVPLRDEDRWTGARMQQGRVLLDHEWNLNLDAADRTARGTARDVIGPAGVPAGSPAFHVGLSTTGPRDLTVQPGRMWVEGQAAYAPTAFRYSDQDTIPALPASGRLLVYLDVFPEHLQPGEAWDQIVDPALDPVEAGARTRVGFRVRVATTTATSGPAALLALGLRRLSTGTVNVSRTIVATPADPCDPPGDPLGLLPNGLLRIEVLDGGTAGSARFVWAGDNGASTVRVRTTSGATATLAPSQVVKFAAQDLVEISWTARRGDRVDHGALYRVVGVAPAAAGDLLTLDRAVAVPVGARGIVARRWDGQTVGAVAPVVARLGGADLGLRFSAATSVGTPPAAAAYLTGDSWQAWLRPDSSTGVEARTAVGPDGVPHSYVALALVDLSLGTVEDCRPTFPPLTALPRTTCTVTAFPGDDLQALANTLPVGGGELCLAAGRYPLDRALRMTNRRRIVITGVGPATVLTSATDSAVLFENCQEVEVTGLRAERGAGSDGLDGALTFVGCSRIRVANCTLACADAGGDRSQTGLTVRGTVAGQPREVRVQDNRFEIGTGQIGLLILNGQDIAVQGNDLGHATTSKTFPLDPFVAELARVAADTDDTTNRYGARLLGLGAELRDRAAPLVAQGLPLRRALRRVARLRVQEIGVQNAPLLVGATGLNQLVSASQGIVVAGRRAQTVRVLDNVVGGVTQGIHVGTSDPATAGADSAADVLLARNVISVVLPAVYNRGRHAVFVGNAERLAVLETFAELRRLHGEERSSVDGIRVYGLLGPYVMVRESSLSGFSVGVRVQPRDTTRPHLWVVTDTVASGTRQVVLAPAGVPRDPNLAVP